MFLSQQIGTIPLVLAVGWGGRSPRMKMMRAFFLLPVLMVLFCVGRAGGARAVGVESQRAGRADAPDASQGSSGVLAKAKLLVGSAYDHAPFEFQENGRAAGFDINLIRAVAEVMDFEVEIRLDAWAQLQEDLKNGQLDLLAGMAYTRDRDKYFDFSVPHAMIPPGLFVRTDSSIRSFADLEGKEVIVQEADAMHEVLQREGIASRIIPVSGTAEALRRLASGAHDAVLMPSKLLGLHDINQFGLSNLKAVPTGLPARRYGFAVREGNLPLVYKLNEGLKILKATGKYRDIYDRWFGVYEPSVLAASKPILIALLVIAAILALSLLWLWSLRRQVRRRTAELRASEERFRVLIEQAPEAILVYDGIEGRFVHANRNAERLFEATREEILQKGLEHFYAPNQPDGRSVHESIQDHIRRTLAGKELAFERIIHPAGGGEVSCDVRAVGLPSSEGRKMRLSYIDITERKRAEEELRKHRDHLEELVHERTVELATANAALAQRSTQLCVLANQLIEAEQRERRRIAYVLHENFQQLLAATKFSIQHFRDKGSLLAVQQALESLDQAIAISRSLTVELRPPVLYELGLGPALEWLGRQVYDKFNLTVELHLDRDADPVSDNLRSFLFEAVRELLLNVTKHAKVDAAHVRLSRVDDQIQLQIVDHGVGFDPAQTHQARFGLFSIRERVELLGGHVDIESAPSQGTSITLAIPLVEAGPISRAS